MAASEQLANSIEGQVSQLTKGFGAVKKSAGAFEASDAKTTRLLYLALAKVYDFGEGLIAHPSPAGISVVAEVIQKLGGTYNKRTKINPYIALVKLAFPSRSDSSVSQYSTVLRFANAKKVKAADFLRWLDDAGIEARRGEALDYFDSATRNNNNQARMSRLKRATATLLARPHSAAVALPAGVEAQEGFALVLARIDGSNQAQIIEVIEGNQATLEPTILRFDGDKSSPMAHLTSKPLGNLYRAIDIILGVTPAKVDGKTRDILIANETVDGREVCRVQAISEAYSAPGVRVEMVGHLLADPDPVILHAGDAETFREAFAKHENWRVYRDTLTGDGLAQPIRLYGIPTDHSYRAAAVSSDPNRAVTITQAQQVAAIAYLDGERAAVERQNAGRKEKRSMSGTLNLTSASDRLLIAVPRTLASCQLGTIDGGRDIEDRELMLGDVDGLLDTILPYEVDLHGSVVDVEVDDAALLFDIDIEGDRVSIVLPTSIDGSSYAQVFEPLNL